MSCSGPHGCIDGMKGFGAVCPNIIANGGIMRLTMVMVTEASKRYLRYPSLRALSQGGCIGSSSSP